VNVFDALAALAAGVFLASSPAKVACRVRNRCRLQRLARQMQKAARPAVISSAPDAYCACGGMEEKRDAVGHEEIEDPGPRHRSEYPRSLYTLPNGDVLVMDSKAPKAAAIKRPKEIVMGYGVSGMND
jgi:hypothetical protein